MKRNNTRRTHAQHARKSLSLTTFIFFHIYFAFHLISKMIMEIYAATEYKNYKYECAYHRQRHHLKAQHLMMQVLRGFHHNTFRSSSISNSNKRKFLSETCTVHDVSLKGIAPSRLRSASKRKGNSLVFCLFVCGCGAVHAARAVRAVRARF